MTTPTPGPWIIGTIKANNADVTEDALSIWPATIIEYGQPVCLISPLSQLSDTDLMNAQLIASAPHLLSVLKALTESYQDFVHDAHEDKEYQDAMAAIAIATRPLPTPSPVTFSAGETVCPWCKHPGEPIDNGITWPECPHCGGN